MPGKSNRNADKNHSCSPYSAFRLILLAYLFCFFTANAVSAATEGNTRDLEMVLIPAGDFFMGTPESSSFARTERPRHKVFLDAFFMDKFEVSNEKFVHFLNSFKGNFAPASREKWIVIRDDLAAPGKEDWWPAEIVSDGVMYKPAAGFEKYPVTSVSWFAAEAYCKWRGGRLPTEAEWEKAARGGLSDKIYPWGDELPTYGIVLGNTWRNNYYAAPVERIDTYLPNGYGLYHTAGNVSEWCSDWYNDTYYQISPSSNPKGPDSGKSRVVRGGSWASDTSSTRVASRNYSQPHFLNSGVGFRCAKNADAP